MPGLIKDREGGHRQGSMGLLFLQQPAIKPEKVRQENPALSNQSQAQRHNNHGEIKAGATLVLVWLCLTKKAETGLDGASIKLITN